jgi:hypothetical protein
MAVDDSLAPVACWVDADCSSVAELWMWRTAEPICVVKDRVRTNPKMDTKSRLRTLPATMVARDAAAVASTSSARFRNKWRSSEARGAAQVDQALELGHLGRGERNHLVQVLLLGTIVGRQLAQVGHGGLEGRHRGAVRLEKGLVARDDVAARPSLGVLQDTDDLGDVLQHLMGVRDVLTGGHQRIRRVVRGGSNGQEQHGRHRETGSDLLPERPHPSLLSL